MKLLLAKKYWIISGAFVTSIVYVIFLIQQLNMELECTPDDEFCTSGNTVSGDIIWSIVLTLFLAVPLWVCGALLYLVVRSIAENRRIK